MAWNEPGGNQNKPDPWGGGKKPTPPDLNVIWQELKKKWQQFRGRLPKKPGPRWGRLGVFISRYGHYAFPALLLVIWLATGITSVDIGEEAVVLQLGKYHKTLGAGMHWVPPLVDKTYIVDKQQINTINLSGNLVTNDKQVLVITLNVQYRIANAQAYLFAMADPVQSLEDAIASVTNQTIGRQTAAALLSESHQTLSTQLTTGLNQSLPAQLDGLVITDVSVQALNVPSAVADAHSNVLKAQQDNQQVIQSAKESASQTLSQMQIRTQRLLADARAYQQKVVIKAEGNTARYLALLPEYQQNPSATRNRLYVDSMQNVLSKMTKIFVDVPANSGLQITIPPLPAQPGTEKSAILEMSNTQTNTAEEEADETESTTTEKIPGYGNPSNSY